LPVRLNVNPPSFRFPFNLTGKVDPEVENAIRWTYNGLTNHEQAFQALNTKVDAISTSATTAAPQTIEETVIDETVVEGAQVGGVDNQTDATAYTIRQSDGGSKLILNDASAIAVSLVPVTVPFMCWVSNYGAGTATLTPVAPATISFGTTLAATSMTVTSGTTAVIFFDGQNWYA
jgi:hypothetical protein